MKENMSDLPRLNRIIDAFERGDHAFISFCPPEPAVASALSAADYDGILFELEHNIYDIKGLRDSFQYLLDRKQIVAKGSLASPMAPIVRVPANGREANQWLAKQVLDLGAFGIIWPHIETVDQAYAAVSACRYARPAGAAYHEPRGSRGDGPKHAVKYWGVSQQEYYKKADVWPLNPEGEILVGIMCESLQGIKNLPTILKTVPGIGMVLIGEGDLTQEMGYPRNVSHPEVIARVKEAREICLAHNVICAHPNVDEKNIEEIIGQGYRCLMPSVVYSFGALEKGKKILSSQS